MLPPRPGDRLAQGSLLRALRELLDDLPGLVSDRVHLLALELKRAGGALGQMVALYALAAIAGFTAWTALWVGVVAGLLRLGLGWGWSVLAVVAFNLLLALFAIRRAGALTRLLKLPATMRSLTMPPIEPVPPPAASFAPGVPLAPVSRGEARSDER